MKIILTLSMLGLLACAGSRPQPVRSSEIIYDGPARAVSFSHNDDFMSFSTDLYEPQTFKVTARIIFPRLTLKQALELETKLQELLPEAQEIDLNFYNAIEVPVDKFYFDLPFDSSGIMLYNN